MHDFDYDCMQKKRTASGAVHRKRGSKSKKCTLPSDYLTKKELKAMNGEVKTYNIHQRMTWEEVKALPEDVAKAHINWLVEEFGCNAGALAEAFGCTDSTVFAWMKKHGMKLGYRRFMGNKGWLTFLGKMPVVAEEEVVEETVEEVTESSGVRTPEDMDAKFASDIAEVEIVRGNFVLKGRRAQMLVKLLELLPDGVSEIDVTFYVKK